MSMATRAGTVQLPLGQLLALGMGVACVMNPEKVLTALHKSTQAFLLPSPYGQQQHQQQQPIVIHQTSLPVGSSTSKSIAVTVIQLVAGAGFCWGTYMILINALPEAMTSMMPVTKSRFNQAVTSLGKAVINLKETLTEQILGLSKKQDDLGEKQQETHEEVLVVKDNVSDLKQDLTLIQESLNLCHSTLSESDRRTAYIAHGVQLLTRGVSTFLPEDDSLLNELLKFNECAGDEFKNPAQLLQLRQVLRSLQKTKQQEAVTAAAAANGVPQAVLLEATSTADGRNPSSQMPETPASAVDKSVGEIRALIDSCRYGTVM